MAETKTVKTVKYAIDLINAENVQKAIRTIGKETDETGKYFKSFRQILSEGNKQLTILEYNGKKGTKQYEELAEALGGVKDAMDKANAAIKANANDTKTLTDALDVFKTGTSVVGLFNSALVALGTDEDKLGETTKKLIAIQTTLNSVQQIQESLMNKSSGTYRALHKLKTILISDTNKERLANSKLGKVINLVTSSTQGLTLGMKLLRGAIISTGIGLLVVAVGELINNWDKLTIKLTNSIPFLKTVGGWFSSIGESISNFFGGSVKSSEDVKNNIESIVSLVDKYDSTLSKQIKLAKDTYDQNKRMLEIEKASYEERKKAAKDYYDQVSSFISKYADKLNELVVSNNKVLESAKELEGEGSNFVKKELYEKLEKIPVDDLEILTFPEKINESLIDILNSGEEYFKKHKDIAKQFTDFEIRYYTNLSNIYKLVSDEEKKSIIDYIESVRIGKELTDSFLSMTKKKADFYFEYLDEIKSLEDKETKDAKERADKARKILEERYKKEIEEKRKNAELDQKLREAELERLRLFTEDEKKLLKEREENLQKQHQDLLNILKEQLKKRLITQKEYNEQEKIAQKEYNVEFYKIVTERIKLYQQAKEKELQYLKELRAEELNILSSDQDLSKFFELGKVEKAQEQFGKYSLKNLKEIYSKYTTEQKMFIVERQRLELEELKQERDTIEKNTKITNEERIRQLTLLNKQEESLRKQHALEILEFDKESNKNFKTILEERRDTVLSLTEQTLSTAASITSSIFELIDANIQRTMDKISESITSIEEQLGRVDRNINRHINRLTGYYEALSDSTGEEKQDLLAYIKDQEDALNHQYNLEQQLEKKKYEKEKELKREENRQKKVQLQNQLIQAIITGATATLNGFATQPFLPVGVAMGALASTLSAIQIGIISSNIGKIKYAEGGMLNGPSHSNGGIPVGNTGIEVEGGEYVVNKKATKRFLPILEQINDYGRSTRKFANGGQMNLITESDKTSTLLDNINFSPVVSVVDINRENNRLSKVRVLSQI